MQYKKSKPRPKMDNPAPPPAKFPISNAIKKEIRKLVKNLPEMENKDETESRLVRGSTLLDIGEIFDYENKPIKFSKYYLFNFPKKQNHQLEAENRFKQFGMDAVVRYCDAVLKRVEEAKKEQILRRVQAEGLAEKKRKQNKA